MRKTTPTCPMRPPFNQLAKLHEISAYDFIVMQNELSSTTLHEEDTEMVSDNHSQEDTELQEKRSDADL